MIECTAKIVISPQYHRIYQTDLYEVFEIGRYLGVVDYYDICFVIAQGTLTS